MPCSRRDGQCCASGLKNGGDGPECCQCSQTGPSLSKVALKLVGQSLVGGSHPYGSLATLATLPVGRKELSRLVNTSGATYPSMRSRITARGEITNVLG
jgi:hypothetical protein